MKGTALANMVLPAMAVTGYNPALDSNVYTTANIPR
jgi:hypothetical protein